MRIGVYGGWGSGKTTVLGFVEEMAKAERHVVVRFNPWGHVQTRLMWAEFVKELRQALAEAGVDNEWTAYLGEIADGLEGTADVAEQVTGSGIAERVVRALLPNPKRGLAEMAVQLGNVARSTKKRIVVLVDDVDRADPGLIPQLLFAVREILDIPGLSWVLALDPETIGAALKEHHPGFADRRQFLEKIVEYPLNVPTTKPEQRWRLAQRDLRDLCPFVDSAAVKQEFGFFPESPRALRTFIRSLATLAPEVQRHQAGEIDWTLVILTSLIRFHFPGIAARLFVPGELVKAVSQASVMRLVSRKDGEHKKEADEFRVTIDSVVDTAKLSDNDAKTRARDLLMALADRRFWPSEQILYHADLGERPDPVTWKEFYEIFDRFPDLPSVDAQGWIVKHADSRGETHERVCVGLFETALAYHQRQMESAIHAATGTAQNEHIASAYKAIGLAEFLAFDVGRGGTWLRLGTEQFRRVFQRVMEWAHFESSEYQALRPREQGLLVRLAREADGDPAEWLDVARPWQRRLHPEGAAPRAKVIGAVTEVLLPKVAPLALAQFRVAGGVAAVAHRTEYVSHRYVLFRVSSPLWSFDHRVATLKSLEGGDEIIIDNLYDFLRLLAPGRDSNIHPKEAEAFLRDKALVTQLWALASVPPVNPRGFTTITSTRAALERPSVNH